jgi:hypothetical protein
MSVVKSKLKTFATEVLCITLGVLVIRETHVETRRPIQSRLAGHTSASPPFEG